MFSAGSESDSLRAPSPRSATGPLGGCTPVWPPRPHPSWWPRLEKLLLVPEGARRSELDRLRRPPFTPTITGLVKALQRLAEMRGLGASALDGIPVVSGKFPTYLPDLR